MNIGQNTFSIDKDAELLEMFVMKRPVAKQLYFLVFFLKFWQIVQPLESGFKTFEMEK